MTKPAGSSATVLVAATVAAAVSGYAVYARVTRSRERAVLVAAEAEPRQYKDSALVVVVDVGSSSIRASCFALVDVTTGSSVRGRFNDGHGHSHSDVAGVGAGAVEWVMLLGSKQQLPLDDIINSHGEADIARIEAAVETVLDRVAAFLRDVGLQSRVCGVGFSTFVMNLLGVDGNGAPVTPVYTYAGRRPSTAAAARQLREKLISRGCLDEFHDRTGTVIHPAYAPAEFLRLHNEEPNTVARVHKWQSISSYLLSKWMLAGERSLPISFTEASWTGLFDFRRAQWDMPLLELVHMDKSKMPALQDSSVPISGLRPAYTKRWPEWANVPFFLGIGDGAAANVGSKCIDSSRIAVTVGTSAALRVVLPNAAMTAQKVPAGLWCYRIGKEQLMLGGALNDGGSVFQFFRESMNISLKELDAKLESARPAQHGLTMLPFLSGERAPGWRDDATCAITGISKWTSPVDFLQAGMEAVVMRVALVFSLVAAHANADAVVVASGTALTASRAWRQMLADAIGRELAMETSANEATSRGVAVFLGRYLGLHSFADTQKLSDQLVHSYPSVSAHTAYLAARQTQEALYRKLYTE